VSQPYEGDSTSPTIPGIKGINTATTTGGVGVYGESHGGAAGVAGFSATGDGARGDTQASAKNGIVGTNSSTNPAPAGQVGGNGVFGYSQNPHASGVYGAGAGTGVAGFSTTGDGARGDTQAGAKNGIVGTNSSTDQPTGGSPGGNGVFGYSQNPHASGVYGAGAGTGVAGFSTTGDGARGDTQASAKNGMVGTNSSTDQPTGGSPGGNGVFGYSQNPHASGVYGAGAGAGVAGFSDVGTGVNGISTSGLGVSGSTGSASQSAIFGINNATGPVPDGLNRPAGGGVWGHTRVEKGSGVIGSVEPGLTQAAGVTGIGPIAGHFFGNVIVTGDVLLTGADCAEDFDIASEGAEAGTVMVLSDQEGALHQSEQAYDKRVAGVISGAGKYRPGITLDRRQSRHNRMPVALVGKVYCKVDADASPIQIGDLLTTSSTSGHAMKASDPFRAFGAVLGKALGALQGGKGLIPILVALQ